MIRYDLIPQSPEWHAERAKGIGGSEIAGLFRQETRTYGKGEWALYQEKSGSMEIPFVGSERAELGQFMEAGIIAAAAAREGWTTRTGGYAVCDDNDQIRHSLDAEADRIPARLVNLPAWEMISGPGVVEAKLVSKEAMLDHFGWDPKNPERPTPPVRMVLQLQHGMLATGYQWGVLCILFEGDNLQAYYYRRSDRVHEQIRLRVARLYAAIAFRKPPPVDANVSTERAIKRHFTRTNGKHLDVPVTMRELFDEACGAREVAEANRKHWDEQAHLHDNTVRRMLGHFETAHGDHWFATLKPDKNGNRRRLNIAPRERQE